VLRNGLQRKKNKEIENHMVQKVRVSLKETAKREKEELRN